MQISGISETQIIHLRSETGHRETYEINIIMDPVDPVFFVYSYANEEWIWEFKYTNKTDYERVKQCIIDMVYGCENIDELMYALNDVFMEYFSDMLIYQEDEYQCENVSCSKYLN